MALDEPHAVSKYPDIGNHRTGEPAGDDGYRTLHRLVRTHELRGPPSFDRASLDECGVEISCDAEAEHAAFATATIHSRCDRFRIPLAHRRLAVGHEENQSQRAGWHISFGCRVECAGDIRRARW